MVRLLEDDGEHWSVFAIPEGHGVEWCAADAVAMTLNLSDGEFHSGLPQ